MENHPNQRIRISETSCSLQLAITTKQKAGRQALLWAPVELAFRCYGVRGRA